MSTSPSGPVDRPESPVSTPSTYPAGTADTADTTGTAGTAALPMDDPLTRPRVLALPSPTAVRSLVLVGALLSAGLFVGTWFHNETSLGVDWVQQVADCSAGQRSPSATDVEGSLLEEQSFLACVASAQTTLAAFAIGGALLAALLGVAVALVVPSVIERRRRLRAHGAAVTMATPRVGELGAELGLRHSPRVLVGPPSTRDAFSYGLPGRYRIVLPTAVAIRPRDARMFEPLVRHELAHVRRGDVVLAWAARSFWLALVPLLVAPVVLAAAERDLSLLPSYLWRAAVLLAVTALAAAAILRGREFEADLDSAGSPAQRESLALLLDRVRPRPLPRWRRSLAYHPDPAERRATLADPSRATRLSVLDGLTAAFLAALVVPLLVSVVTTLPSVREHTVIISTALVGAMLGTTLGLGLWRRSLVCRVTAPGAGASPSVRPDALRLAGGVFVGHALGGYASLGQVGGSTVTGLDHPWVVLVSALASAGATVVVAALGELATAVAPSVGRRTYAALCVLLSTLAFVLVLWAATTLTQALDLGGWMLGSAATVTIVVPLAVGWGALVLAVAVAAIAFAGSRLQRVPAAPPDWLLEKQAPASSSTREVPGGGVDAEPAFVTASAFGSTHPEAPHWAAPTSARDVAVAGLIGLTTGGFAAASIWLYRALAGPAPDQQVLEQRYYAYVWVFGTAGLVAMVVSRIRWGFVGIALGLVSGLVASTVAALGFVIVNWSYGGAITVEFVMVSLRPAIGLGLLLAVLGSALLVGGRPVRRAEPEESRENERAVRDRSTPAARRRRTLAVLALAAVLAAGLAQAVVAARDVVAPRFDEAAMAAMVRQRLGDTGDTARSTVGADAEVTAYLSGFVPDVGRRLIGVRTALADIVGSPTTDLPALAARVQAEVIDPLEGLRNAVAQRAVRDPALLAAHQLLANVIGEELVAARLIGDAYAEADPARFNEGATLWVAAQQEYADWLSTMLAMRQRVTRS
ncbi:hypothetical protein GCM10027053_28060 [Intrasporangium mesophilum]